MPSILSPGSSSSSNSRSYTPLADEVNPPIGANVPTVTRNGTVVYAKRAHSDSSRSGSSTPIRGDSAPANHLIASRVAMMKANEEHTVSARRGKGKERAWDAEMGEEKEDSYPPMQETAEEERRIADVGTSRDPADLRTSPGLLLVMLLGDVLRDYQSSSRRRPNPPRLASPRVHMRTSGNPSLAGSCRLSLASRQKR